MPRRQEPLPASSTAEPATSSGSVVQQQEQAPARAEDKPQPAEQLPPPQRQPEVAAGPPQRAVHIAVQGCCHGELDAIYNACREHEDATDQKIDFLLCCGDFQSIRDGTDLDCMAVPNKYKVMGDFHKYRNGTLTAPYLTIFIGGNHEASNFLLEEYYGGFVAPNIYYVGHSGVIDVCGVVVAGISGIFKGRDYERPYPVPPYDNSSVREAYHVRKHEVEKLKKFGDLSFAEDASRKRHVDIVMSHDWPIGITKFGNEQQLIRHKPYFEDDIKHGALGNPHLMPLLMQLRPRYWLSAHLHCYFSASVPHTVIHPNGRSVSAPCSPTQFLALDKCVHNRTFLDFIDIPTTRSLPKDGVAANAGDCMVHNNLWLQVVRQSHPPPTLRGQQHVVTQLGVPPSAGATLPCSSTTQFLRQMTLPAFYTKNAPTMPVARQAPARVPVPQPQMSAGPPVVVAPPTEAAAAEACCEWEEDLG